MEMKKLIVPRDLYKWLMYYVDMKDDDYNVFEAINDIMVDYHSHKFQDETRRFIYYYMDEICEVISGKREYEVEEDEFYALMIGYENVQGTPHWAYSRRKDRLSINYLTGYHGDVIKMTRDEWSKLNINDSNAIFTLTLKK